MIQYYIKKKSSCRFIRKLYKTFLAKDRHWHFFHEDTYMLLRLKRKSWKIEEYLDSKWIPYDVSVWTDPHFLVRKHQDLFKDIFHAYSVLAMKVNKKEYIHCVNRMIHCFCNMTSETMRKLNMNESVVVASHLISAAYGHGRIDEQKLMAKKGCRKKKK